jgi:hypothetical protein
VETVDEQDAPSAGRSAIVAEQARCELPSGGLDHDL